MKLYQVDAFATRIFQGNPAGVCPLDQEKMGDDAFLLALASEMNLSETAFFCPEGDKYRLRWFTPSQEVSLCGHATLSTAHIIWELGWAACDQTLIFKTLSGELPVRRLGEQIELDFPRFDVHPVEYRPDIAAGLGARPVFIGTDGQEYLLEIGSAEELRHLEPDFGRLKAIGPTAFILTSRSDDPQYDFLSRFFAPAVGIDEDPVTGSAHTRLAPYWAKKLGKTSLVAYQASRRGGHLECELAPGGRVLIRGRAVTVFEMNLRGF